MISADPNRAVWFPLELRPEKQFLCRFMSLREHQQIDDLLTEATKVTTESEAGNLLVKVIAIGVIDWKGFDKPFSVDAVASELTPDEIMELAVGYRFAVRAKESDLKKSKRESSSSAKVPASVAGSTIPVQ